MHLIARRAEDGFTLVEMLVAMAGGIVLLFALTNIMIVALHQSQRTFTRVDATRRARTALATIENELHSACVASNPPVQAGSTGTTIDFISAYGDQVTPKPIYHVLSLNQPDPTKAGTLTDTTYNAVPGATSGTYVPGTQIAQTQLLDDVGQIDPSTPAFQYFAYRASPQQDAQGNTYYYVPDGMTPDPMTADPKAYPITIPSGAPPSGGLQPSDAASTVEVMINLLVGASSSSLTRPSLSGTSAPVTDTVSLRLTTPPDDVPSGSSPASNQFAPCQ